MNTFQIRKDNEFLRGYDYNKYEDLLPYIKEFDADKEYTPIFRFIT